MRISAKRLEAILRDSSVPYVSVDEAKRALFAGVRLRSFHFVVYSEGPDNWLVTCRPFSADMRRTMEQWQEVFGPGFVSVEARLRQGRVVFVTLVGTVITPPLVSLGTKALAGERQLTLLA